MLQISIPEPCHENWNEMTPTERGAFCKLCAKDVVDFTKMTDDEVQYYLLNKAGEKVCGKFNNHQLADIRVNIPDSIFYSKIAGWKKFMAVLMIVFGNMLFGCKNPQPIVGELVATPQDTIAVKKDSVCYDHQTMGIVAPLPPIKKDSIDDLTTVGKIVYTPEKTDTAKKSKKDAANLKRKSNGKHQ